MKFEEGDFAEIKGWVYRIRKLSNLIFIVVRDSTGILQCVVDKSNNAWDDANKLTLESSVVISGKLRQEKKAPGGLEIETEHLKIVQIAEPFPITKDFSEEFLLDNRHLWLRSRKITSIMKIRSTVIGAIESFFRKNGYFEWHPPIFQPNQSEGGATLFEVKYFDKITYLTQSWQLYAEAAVFSLERIFDIAPTFRAERSRTSRHLAEFWMAEMEAAWMNYLEAIHVAFDEIRYIVKEVVENNKSDLETLKVDVDKLVPLIYKEYKIMKYEEVLKILKDKFNMEVPWGKDLRTIEEKKLMSLYDVPVAVTHYPSEAMAFYKPEDENEDKAVSKCFDILAPGVGEIVGGSERDLDIERMSKKLKEQGENPDNYSWYFDLRRYGSVVHSGYGLGVERILMWLLNLDNIKDTIPFPRTMMRFKP